MPLPFQTFRDLFEGLPPEEIRAVERLFLERRFQPESVIFYEGAEPDALFMIQSGLVKLVALSERGEETILHILRPGDVFGEALAGGGARPFTALAMTPVVARALSRRHLLDLLGTRPAFARNYTALLSKRLARVEREFAMTLSAFAHARLARELLHLSEDLGVASPGGTLISAPLTHEDLSHLIGTTRETVTLLLRKFERKGYIRRLGRRLVVDRQRLAEYAGGGPMSEEGDIS